MQLWSIPEFYSPFCNCKFSRNAGRVVILRISGFELPIQNLKSRATALQQRALESPHGDDLHGSHASGSNIISQDLSLLLSALIWIPVLGAALIGFQVS